ncbi:hypothetical protein C8R45DRAFT_1022053 [Mycena sanguinolenta]|nr:hypothetical protein C8R45DRAFT_1022053 [Mycena sanguinolenta]
MPPTTTAFNLRPVPVSPSPSPTASGGPDDRSAAAPSPAPSGHRRRPLSPSSLRDVDLTHMPDMPPRRYPAPPTGHDLMALFPPAAPDNFHEMRPGPTSGYFQRQERAFFAQAGKEIVRVRVDVDLQHGPDAEKAQGQPRGAPRPWPPTQQRPPPPPGPGPPHARTHSRGPSLSTPITPVFPPHPHPGAPPHHHQTPNPHHASPHLAPPRTRTPAPPQQPSPPTDRERDTDRDRGGGGGGGGGGGDDFRPDDPDEAWRRPMPYNERRRAGKHTRRVVVRS